MADSWLKEEIEKARESIKEWPQWMRDAAYFEGTDVPDYWKKPSREENEHTG